MEVTQAPTVAVEKPNLLPPAGDAKPANGQGAALTTAAVPVPDPEIAKQVHDLQERDTQIQNLGRQIDRKKKEIGKQEIAVAGAKRELEKQRDGHRKLERDRNELIDELTTLAMGKNSERLPFKDPEAAPGEQKPPASNDAWKSVLLGELGIKTKRVLQALHDHNPPILNHGELSAWQEKKGDFWAKDIKGLGDKGRDEIEKAQFAYFNAHPECCQPEKKADSFDDAAIDPTTIKTIVNNPGLIKIEVAQRRGGRWANLYDVHIGKSATGAGLTGDHASEVEAIVSACEWADQFARELLNNKKLPKKSRDQAIEIRRILDRIDKSTAAASPVAAGILAESAAPEPVKNSKRKRAKKAGK